MKRNGKPNSSFCKECYYELNKEKIKKQSLNYYNSNKEEINEKRKEEYNSNKELREKSLKYYYDNKEEINTELCNKMALYIQSDKLCLLLCMS